MVLQQLAQEQRESLQLLMMACGVYYSHYLLASLLLLSWLLFLLLLSLLLLYFKRVFFFLSEIRSPTSIYTFREWNPHACVLKSSIVYRSHFGSTCSKKTASLLWYILFLFLNILFSNQLIVFVNQVFLSCRNGSVVV